MVYGVILAGGVGSRMGNVEKPKQFLEIDKKPILIHTIEKFIINSNFEQIVVLIPKQWIKYTKDIIKKHIDYYEKVIVIEGGSTRNETIINAINYIEERGHLNEKTIIVTHDAVRPFITHRIIEENIAYAKKYGACDTVVPATDTIVESNDGKIIASIPDRSKMYQGQTPQSFKAKLLREYYFELTDTEKEILTDACKIMLLKGQSVHLVQGEVFNIKITYPYDIKIAEALLKEKQND